MSRFGQTAEVYQGKIYFHGGFNGMFLSDFIVFTPGVFVFLFEVLIII